MSERGVKMADEGRSYRVRWWVRPSSEGWDLTFGDREAAEEQYRRVARRLQPGGVAYFIVGGCVLAFTNGRTAYGIGGQP